MAIRGEEKMLTNYGKEMICVRIGSNIGVPQYIGVGAGSAAVNATRSGLITEFTRAQFTNSGSINFATPQYLSFQSDFSSVTMSGCALKEFGVFVPSSGANAWLVEGFPTTTFDGTQELTVECQVGIK